MEKNRDLLMCMYHFTCLRVCVHFTINGTKRFDNLNNGVAHHRRRCRVQTRASKKMVDVQRQRQRHISFLINYITKFTCDRIIREGNL